MPDKLVPNKGQFKAGHTKLGGRKKTVVKARDLVTKYGDPLVWMLRLLRDGVYDAVVIDADGTRRKVPTVAPLELLLDAAKSCVGFVHPKLTSTQLSGPDDGPIQSVTLNLDSLLQNEEWCRQAQAVALQVEAGQDATPGKGDVVVYNADYEPSKE
jgi:hypothetical protein